MIDGRKVLAILPARGGSKGIPRKNVRLLAGRPLIVHVIDAARRSSLIDEVIVSTEDEEIAAIASRSGARVLRRPAALAGDTVTLDPVVFHAVASYEKKGRRADFVLTLQATSPLVSTQTIDALVRKLAYENVDTVVTVRRVAHLCWRRGLGNIPQPLYPERQNRQQLDPLYFETGAVVATRREWVTPSSRFGPRVELYEVEGAEAIDIDDESDWWLAEQFLMRRRILFHVSANAEIGSGHVHRALTLARRMTGHEIFFVSRDEPLCRRLVEQAGGRLIPLSEDGRRTFLDLAPDIVINDVLDTSREFVRFLREEVGAFVVNFEDLGPGSREADLTFNAMYCSHGDSRAYSGPLFECLREEFYGVPARRVRPRVRKVLVTFGGTDPCNLTVRALRALDAVKGEFRVTAVLGPGYAHDRELREVIESLVRPVRVMRNVRSMSRLMLESDLMVTSYGRTLFEAAATATPVVAMAQNTRELRHSFARLRSGVVPLGLGLRCPLSRLQKTLRRLIDSARDRKLLATRLAASGISAGRDIVVDLIFEHYRRSQYEPHPPRQRRSG